jgi:hypothetical protein
MKGVFDTFCDTFGSSKIPNLGSWISQERMSYQQKSIEMFHWSPARRLVHAHWFTSAVGAAITLNAIIVAIDGHIKLQNSLSNYELRVQGMPETNEDHPLLGIINILFVMFFALELLLRVLGEGILTFIGEEWRWNVFDTLLVITSFTSLSENGPPNLSFGRLLRLVRLSRAMRTVRVLKYFQTTRVMLTAVLNSLVPLMWSLLFVALVMFLFGVFMMSAVTEYMDDQGKPSESPDAGAGVAVIKSYYDSFGMTMLSLFMCVSGGQDWWELGEVVVRYNTIYAVVFVLYIALMLLGLLNIINGVFVTAAADMSHMDRETATLAETAKREADVRNLRGIFSEFDKENSGQLTWSEFQNNIDNPQVQAYLSALEINVTKARALFKLLDVDDSESVSLDEFVMGCLRLKGSAKTLDVGTLMYETRSLKHTFNKERSTIKHMMLALNKVVQETLTIVKDQSLGRQFAASFSPTGIREAADAEGAVAYARHTQPNLEPLTRESSSIKL